MRKPFQGVWNIIRFNWHFYVLPLFFNSLMVAFHSHFNTPALFYIDTLCLLIICSTLISLLVSYYIYDMSGLYKLYWINQLNATAQEKILNINAGFDETSTLLRAKFPQAELIVLDFYDPKKHTEVSIKRARKAYPPFPGTQQTNTANLPLEANFADRVFVIFAAHEIRDNTERVNFFRELNRVTKTKGQIIITEHLRDVPNFLAYNIGFFHFYTKASWHKTFQAANLVITKEIKLTPFTSTFILQKNGNPI